MVAAALLTAGAMTACGLYPDATNAVVPPVQKPVAATKAAGVITDSSSGLPVSTAVTVKALNPTGGAASGLVDATGAAVTSFNVTTGVLGFTIAPSVTFPKDVVLTATASGYTTGSTSLHITGPGAYNFTITMVNLSQPPQGAAVATNIPAGSTTSTGTVTAPIAIASPAEASGTTTAAKTDFAVPAGTTITDASGAPLTGALTATVAYFNNTDTESLAAFPGGLASTTVKTSSSTTDTGAMAVAAYTEITITDSAGNTAAHFNQPVAASLGVSPETINKGTGQPLQAGDTIPTWSFNTTTGTWQPEGTANIVSGDGGLIANFTATHLSYWAVGYFYGQNDTCANGITITSSNNSQGLLVNYVIQGHGFYKSIVTADSSIPLTNVPRNLPVTVYAYYAGNLVITQGIAVGDLCGTTGVGIDLSGLPNVQSASLDVSVFDACTNFAATKTGVPNVTVGLTQNGSTVTGFTGGDGHVVFKGIVASAAHVTVNYPKQPLSPQDLTLTAGGNATEFDNPVTCTVATGATGGSL
jgi:hypothetical protein